MEHLKEITFVQNVENVAYLLNKISAENGIERDELVAEIHAVKSFVKGANGVFEKVEDISDEVFEDKSIQIKQSYDVAIFHTKIERKFYIEVLHNGESVDIIFKAGFEIPKNIAEFETLAFAVIALKAEQGIILRDLDNGKNVLYEHLKDLDSPLKSDLRFCLLKSQNFVDSKDGKIDFFIAGVDLAKKNVIALKENTKICTYALAKLGKIGRNLKGEIITPEAKTSLPPSCSDEIKKSEIDGIYEYTTAKNGFVIFEKNHFSFSNEISLQNVELKDNYNFLGDVDTKSKIVVSSGGEFEDALKSGVNLIANQISISGNLAANTNLVANEIEISGQTHKTTTMTCKKAQIATHRGILDCECANITALEGGIINGENIEIAKANGGEICANNINIIELFSGANVKFSAKLVMDCLKGSDNKIIFTPLASRQTKQKIQSLLNELESNQNNEQILKKRETALSYQYNKFAKTARELKAQIEDNKAKNRATPEYVLNNYRAFLEIVHNLKATKSELEAIAKQHTIIINTIREYQQSVFSAEFLCKDGWLKYNDVIFELISPKVYQSKTIIKGIGKYCFDSGEKCIVHHKIFRSESDEEINNQGF
ncbi:hypothetical protein ACWIUD_04420 [Helicobacter sp. 23-1044]